MTKKLDLTPVTALPGRAFRRVSDGVKDVTGTSPAAVERFHNALARATLDHCVKCTICETSCPVAAVTPLFSGPKFGSFESNSTSVPPANAGSLARRLRKAVLRLPPAESAAAAGAAPM